VLSPLMTPRATTLKSIPFGMGVWQQPIPEHELSSVWADRVVVAQYVKHPLWYSEPLLLLPMRPRVLHPMTVNLLRVSEKRKGEFLSVSSDLTVVVSFTMSYSRVVSL